MKCYNGGLKHNFKPRYDEKPSGYELSGRMAASEARKMMIVEVYVKDICIWCGKEINKRT